MESISTEILLELHFALESSIDVQFQAWMAITFAVIVASYSSRDTLRTELRIIVAIAYLMAAYTLFARWMTEVSRINELIQPILESRGLDLNVKFYTATARMVTYALGTLIATVSIFFFRPKNQQPEDNSDGDT